MKTVRASQPVLDGIVPYDPKYLPAETLLSANENPLNLPEDIVEEIITELRMCAFNRYPDPLANELRDLIAQANGLKRENVLMGNGGDELLFDMALAWGCEGRKFLTVVPTFSVYQANALLNKTEAVLIERKDNFEIDEEAVLERVAQGDIDYVIITSPNNPTGTCARVEFIEELLNTTDALVMVDEAYSEFSKRTLEGLLSEHKNLLLLRTFSKAYRLAGVRLGYILAHEDVIKEFIKVRQPYSVDAVSQLIGKVVFTNRDKLQPAIDEIIRQRGIMAQNLAGLEGVEVFDSQANYLLIRLPDADKVWDALYEKGILVRDFSKAKYLTNCLRITVGTEEENNKVVAALAEILTERK